MQEVELKPCPFCGHKIDLEKICTSQAEIGIRRFVTLIVAVTL